MLQARPSAFFEIVPCVGSTCTFLVGLRSLSIYVVSRDVLRPCAQPVSIQLVRPALHIWRGLGIPVSILSILRSSYPPDRRHCFYGGRNRTVSRVSAVCENGTVTAFKTCQLSSLSYWEWSFATRACLSEPLCACSELDRRLRPVQTSRVWHRRFSRDASSTSLNTFLVYEKQTDTEQAGAQVFAGAVVTTSF